MSNITIDQLEPDLSQRLEQRAAQHGRTIEAEIKSILSSTERRKLSHHWQLLIPFSPLPAPRCLEKVLYLGKPQDRTFRSPLFQNSTVISATEY